MHDLLTTVIVALLTIIALAGSAVAIRRLLRPRLAETGGTPRSQAFLLAMLGAGAALTLLYRWIILRGDWQPLEAHVDGLLLIIALLAPIILFLQNRSRLPNLSAFALPLVAVLLAWAICASQWTLHVFEIRSVWSAVHHASVYVGFACVALAAASGVMFLYVRSRLRHKHDLAGPQRLASLEAIEAAVIRFAGFGFALLTLGVVSGLIITPGSTAREPGWWFSSKVILATASWLIYALVMNVRHTTHFRGARAAWLSIAGLILLLATFGAVSRLAAADPQQAPSPATAPLMETPP